MKKLLSLLLTAVLLLTLLLPTAVAADSGTISIELDKQSAKVGDYVTATIRLQNITTRSVVIPLHFNPAVVKVVDNSGALVPSGVKKASDVRDGRTGITPLQMLSSAADGSGNPLYWNGAIFDNPQYPYLDNTKGLYKMMFTNNEYKLIANETLVSVRFVVIGAGNADIRFAKNGDAAYDPAASGGAVYLSTDNKMIYPTTNIPALTTTESDTPVAPPPTQGGGGGSGGLPSTVTVTEENVPLAGGGYVYEVSENLIDNNIARAAGETGNSMNIRLETEADSYTIKVPVSAVSRAYAANIFTMLFDTPIGIIGFKSGSALSQASTGSQFVVLTLRGDLECSIAIDSKTIQGCILGFHDAQPGSTAFSGSVPVLGSKYENGNLIFTAAKNGAYTIRLQTLTFKDLPQSHWATPYVQSLVAKGIISGMSATEFWPESNVTREQFAKMIVSALDIYDANATCNFPDLPATHWAYRYVASAVKAGIINGYADGTFGTGMNVTRQEIAVMVGRCGLDIAPSIAPVTFTDNAAIGAWAKDAVSTMQMAGIISGFDDGTFRPQEKATRSQAAKIIYGVLGF